MSALNDATNSLASQLDSLEIAPGGTVTDATIATIKAVSAGLKELGAPAVAAPADEPAPKKASK